MFETAEAECHRFIRRLRLELKRLPPVCRTYAVEILYLTFAGDRLVGTGSFRTKRRRIIVRSNACLQLLLVAYKFEIAEWNCLIR